MRVATGGVERNRIRRRSRRRIVETIDCWKDGEKINLFFILLFFDCWKDGEKINLSRVAPTGCLFVCGWALLIEVLGSVGVGLV